MEPQRRLAHLCRLQTLLARLLLADCLLWRLLLVLSSLCEMEDVFGIVGERNKNGLVSDEAMGLYLGTEDDNWRLESVLVYRGCIRRKYTIRRYVAQRLLTILTSQGYVTT